MLSWSSPASRSPALSGHTSSPWPFQFPYVPWRDNLAPGRTYRTPLPAPTRRRNPAATSPVRSSHAVAVPEAGCP